MSDNRNGLEISLKRPSLEQAIQLTALGFVRPIDDELRRDVEEHLESGHDFYTATNDCGEQIAYSIFCHYQSPIGKVLYLSGVIIDPAYQGRHLNRRIMQKAFADHRPDYLSFRTQSVRMYEAGKKIVKELFPKLESDVTIPEDIRLVGELMASLKGGQFPLTRGCYDGKPLYGVKPQHSSAHDFYELCNFERGDALLCVGKPKHDQAESR